MPNRIHRREFLRRAGLTTAATMAVGGAGAGPSTPMAKPTRVTLLVDPSDGVAMAKPAQWAIGHLLQTLLARGGTPRMVRELGDVGPTELCIVAAGPSPLAGRVPVADAPEALAIGRVRFGSRDCLLARGRDPRGLVYALTDLADVASLAADPIAALASVSPASEQPANAVRSCMRMFCSDVEDKAWFNDREFWKSYLTMLVTERFNRFNLSLGLGYDFTREVRDACLHFAYPFLLKVPGYAVRATNLPDSERDRNLETLRFISDEAAARGLHFQLGLWTHAYEWTDSPDANHRIEGLTPATHAAYCRDALTLLLRECPSIAGVTLRTHGESGVSEGSYEFWSTVFEGVARAGRPVEIDLHAKGLDQRTIDSALATRQPVLASPKFWAEHMGLPYHQAWIRPTELPDREQGDGLFSRSSGSRSFLRYGYGDLLTEDRRYGIVHRIWPGTQRLLLWGDPIFAAAYGRASSFCGSVGVELMEPLSFKGRKGSGQNADRTGLVALAPARDFEKYRYSYRLWGRLTYNPDAAPETWGRLLGREYGPAAPAVEAALGHSSRILPLLTTAHTPSAANNHWWPEMYVNMSIVDASHPEPYTDTPVPKRFGAVSPLDPQLFSRVDDFATDTIAGKSGGRYSPVEVATWLEALAETSAMHLKEAEAAATDRANPAFRRFAIDTGVAIDLGRFFADKLRAAVLHAVAAQTADPRALARAIETYRSARQAWARIVERTKGVYVRDVSYGIAWYQRGHWSDRLPAIDEDIAAMERQLAAMAPAVSQADDAAGDRLGALLRPGPRPEGSVAHTPPPSFHPGRPLAIELVTGAAIETVLYYRHVNQAEPWQTTQMKPDGGRQSAVIPADYLASPFPLQYYFELRAAAPARAWLHPGFNSTWSNQPYFLVRPA